MHRADQCLRIPKRERRPVFLYAAVYDEIADAEADYEAARLTSVPRERSGPSIRP